MIGGILQPLLSALIGGLLTGIATLAADRRRKIERLRLKRALSVEIQGSTDRIQRLLEHANGNQLPVQLSTETGFPAEIYRQNLGNIGRLTETEIVAVLDYYQNLSGLKNSLENHRDIHEGEQSNTSHDIKESDMIMFLEFSIELRVQNLHYQQKAALHILSS